MVCLNIKCLRKEKHISQTLLAEKLGMKQSQISKIETGFRKVKADEINKLAEALSVATQELLKEG